jgi:hypothetical protein
MPSQFETQFTTQTPALYEGAFGVVATYTGKDGTAVTTGLDGNPLNIRVDRQDGRQSATPGVSGELQTAEIKVRQSQLAKPQAGGRFTVGSEVWSIQTTPVLKNGQHYCTCARGGVERLMPRRAAE